MRSFSAYLSLKENDFPPTLLKKSVKADTDSNDNIETSAGVPSPLQFQVPATTPYHMPTTPYYRHAIAPVKSNQLGGINVSVPKSTNNQIVFSPEQKELLEKVLELIKTSRFEVEEKKLKKELSGDGPKMGYSQLVGIVGQKLLSAAENAGIIKFQPMSHSYSFSKEARKLALEKLGGWSDKQKKQQQHDDFIKDNPRAANYDSIQSYLARPFGEWSSSGFSLWLEKTNIFGFEERDWDSTEVHPGKTPQRGPNDLPVERMNVQRVIDLLGRYQLGSKKPKSNFMSECSWGDHAGAIRAIITPKINVKIQRLHHDLEGKEVWVMKKYFFIDDYNFAGKEDVVALEIFDQIKRINDEQLESPAPKVKLEELVQSLSSRMNALESSTLLPNHFIKKASSNEFNLSYYLRGGGRGGFGGASTVKNVMEVVVNLSQQPKTGMIKAMVTVVSNIASGSRGGGTWVLMPSDFEEFFMPTQGKKEIVESIITALKTY
jgi:hypothetical protein